MKALLSASFGTSFIETREKTIDAIDRELAEAFPERTFYSTWTSFNIVAKVREERGELHDSPAEAFARMATDSVDDVLVSTMCLMQGHETGKIEKAARAWLAEDASRTVRLARPLLATMDDCRAMAVILADAFSNVSADELVLLMGHGSSHGSNDVYTCMQEALDEAAPGRFVVATVEGIPTFEDVLPAIEAARATCIHLAPLMIVAGDHANNDLAGDEDDSWKSMLEARGFATQAHLRGLGEYDGVRRLICEHATQAPLFDGKE